MSVAAISWAFEQPISRASLKLLLVAMADHAGADGMCYPSVASLCSKTSLDRKTVISGIGTLEKMGYVADTLERRGATAQIKVYELALIKESQKRDSPKKGTVPFSEANSTVFPIKESRFSVKESQKRDTESSRTVREPSGNRQRPTPTAVRIPTTFQLTPERRAVAEGERIDPDRTFAKFTDYWRAASGAKARKLDWDATWRNWCRTEADRGGAKPRDPEPLRTWRPPADEPDEEAERNRRLGIAAYA